MKRWKVTFGLFLLLFALATTVACAETKEAKMDWNDRTVIFAQPGETIHFTYDVRRFRCDKREMAVVFRLYGWSRLFWQWF